MARPHPILLSCVVGLLLMGPAQAQRDAAADESPRFHRQLVPLFSKLGCNSGSCHGAVQGKNGFRLSLFGADPAADHHRLVREFAGRRLDAFEPENSLLLLKASGQVPHGGGKLIDRDGPEYRLLLAWIRQGAMQEIAEDARVEKLTVSPASMILKAGETKQVRVDVTFADGKTQDVTWLCTFEPRDRAIAEADVSGLVKGVGVGSTPLVVRFRGHPAMTLVLVPGSARGDFPKVQENNFIDKHVVDQLRRLNMHPAELCDDITFLRRAHLDVTGALPAPKEIRDFLADKSADKRAKKIDELLTKPGHAALWATKFCDILKPTGFKVASSAEGAYARRFYDWLRGRLDENLAYDQLVERILLATSRESRTPLEWIQEMKELAQEDAAKKPELMVYQKRKTLDLYWQRVNAAGVKGTLQIAHAFLGLRLECAQCHRHPHDVWQQDDLLSFANFFMRVTSPPAGSGSPPIASPEVLKELDKLTQESKDLREQAKGKPKEEAKVLGDKAKLLEDLAKRLKGAEIHGQAKAGFASVTSTLGSQKSDRFRLLGSTEVVNVADRDAREPVMAWLRRPDNPFFAKAIVNRVWAHYFGRGIIDPPDHLSPLNPPTHPELLQQLCDDFVKQGYDLKKLHRLILLSRTYQQSPRPHASAKLDQANFASFYPRRLPAEVLVDAINHATGASETYPPELFLAAGAKAVEVAGASGGERDRASLDYAFKIFGRPARAAEVQCDCERDTTATLVQTLYLANHPRVLAKLHNPQGRLAQVLKIVAEDGLRIDEIYLWTLSRLPTPEERQTCLQYLRDSATPAQGLEDVLWSLLNTREFLLVH